MGVVQAEQQRSDNRTALVETETCDDDVGRTLVFDLEHEAGIGPVAEIERFGDHPVEPGALEPLEPLLRERGIGGRGREMNGGPSGGEGPDEGGTAVGERAVEQRVVAEGEQVEGDEAGGRGLGQQGDAGLCGMDPLGQPVEIEAPAMNDDDLAVHDATARQVVLQSLHQLGKIPGQGLAGAAAELDLIAVAMHDGPEAVPLGLVLHPGRDLRHGLGEHRFHGRHHWQIHASDSAVVRPDPPGMRA